MLSTQIVKQKGRAGMWLLGAKCQACVCAPCSLCCSGQMLSLSIFTCWQCATSTLTMAEREGKKEG